VVPSLPPPRRRQSRAARRFRARYIRYLEGFGFTLVGLIVVTVVGAFVWQVDDVLSADKDLPITPAARLVTAGGGETAFVTRLLVQNGQTVHAGDPLAEVVSGTAAVTAQEESLRIRALLDAPAVAGDGDVRRALQSRLVALSGQQTARKLLHAPSAGMVLLPANVENTTVAAGGEIARVIDLDTLTITTDKLKGETLADARTGQAARLKVIVPQYDGEPVTLRAEAASTDEGPGLHLVSFSLLSPKIKDALEDSYFGQLVTQQNDLAFPVIGVGKVEVRANVNAEEDRSGTPAARPVLLDLPTEATLNATVTGVRHFLKVQVNHLPDSARQRITAMVRKELHGATLDVPEADTAENIRRIRVHDVRHVQITAELLGELPEPSGPTEMLIAQAKRTATRMPMVERTVEVTVSLNKPPAYLKQRLRERLAAGKEVTAHLTVVTGRRALASLLFKW
jgi:pyruvate/2-oxoglutarate dehydrogenase complex dihydrolipoamide acyltransferase (E2) component